MSEKSRTNVLNKAILPVLNSEKEKVESAQLVKKISAVIDLRGDGTIKSRYSADTVEKLLEEVAKGIGQTGRMLYIEELSISLCLIYEEEFIFIRSLKTFDHWIQDEFCSCMEEGKTYYEEKERMLKRLAEERRKASEEAKKEFEEKERAEYERLKKKFENGDES